MTTLCPQCWRVVDHDARRCPCCFADIVRLHERDFREKLLAALSHPIADTVVRAAVALAARGDPGASRGIETAMRRFQNEPHVVAGLLGALIVVDDDDARRIARDALRHRSIIVRRAAAQFFERAGGAGAATSRTCRAR